MRGILGGAQHLLDTKITEEYVAQSYILVIPKVNQINTYTCYIYTKTLLGSVILDKNEAKEENFMMLDDLHLFMKSLD